MFKRLLLCHDGTGAARRAPCFFVAVNAADGPASAKMKHEFR
jgi:hypothetical protein